MTTRKKFHLKYQSGIASPKLPAAQNEEADS